MTVRQEFEEWLVSTQTEALFQKCGGGLARESCSTIVKATWLPKEGMSPKAADLFDAWMSSRAVLVIELPTAPSVPEDPEDAIDDSHMDAYHSAVRMRKACSKSIAAAGLKVTP